MTSPFPGDSTENFSESLTGSGRVTWTSFCYKTLLEEKRSTLPSLTPRKTHGPEEILYYLLYSDIDEFSSTKGEEYKKYLADPVAYNIEKHWMGFDETEKEFGEIIKSCEIWIAANPLISSKVEAKLQEFKTKIQEFKA